MPVSRYCATQFKPKSTGFLYTLRNPEDGYIFYVGKTGSLKSRLSGHISDSNVNSIKGKYIKSILDIGKRPIMGIIEEIKIRTFYDSLYYDFREFYWIRNYLNYGWELTNIRVNEDLCAESTLKSIIATAKSGGGLEPKDFYYDLDHKGFPIYDLDKINNLGYNFSKNQYASHWAYIIDLNKYSNITETTLDYGIYGDIPSEANMIIREDYF